jgi:hypothetical protein
MAGLVPAIHVLARRRVGKTWMPGTRPGMTKAASFGFKYQTAVSQPKAARDALTPEVCE